MKNISEKLHEKWRKNPPKAEFIKIINEKMKNSKNCGEMPEGSGNKKSNGNN